MDHAKANKLMQELVIARCCIRLSPTQKRVDYEKTYSDVKSVEMAPLSEPVQVRSAPYLDLLCLKIMNSMSAGLWTEAVWSFRIWKLLGSTEPKFNRDYLNFYVFLRDRSSIFQELTWPDVNAKLLGAWFSNVFLGLFTHQTVDSGLSLAKALLESYAIAESNEEVLLDICEPMADSMDDAMSSARVMHTVIDPEPGKYNASYAEVRKLLDPQLRKDLKQHHKDFSIAMSRGVAWKDQIATYWVAAKNDDKWGEPLQEALLKDLDKCDSESMKGVLSIFTQGPSECRPNGFYRLQQKLLTWAEHQLQQVTESGSAPDAGLLGTLVAIVNEATLMLDSDPAPLRKRCEALSKQTLNDHIRTVLEEAAGVWTFSDEPPKGFVNHVQSLAGDASPTVKSSMATLRKTALRRVVMLASAPDSVQKNLHTIESLHSAACEYAEDPQPKQKSLLVELLEKGFKLRDIGVTILDAKMPMWAHMEQLRCGISFFLAEQEWGKTLTLTDGVGANDDEQQLLNDLRRVFQAQNDAQQTTFREIIANIHAGSTTAVGFACDKLVKVAGGSGAEGELWTAVADVKASDTYEEVCDKAVDSLMRLAYGDANNSRREALEKARRHCFCRVATWTMNISHPALPSTMRRTTTVATTTKTRTTTTTTTTRTTTLTTATMATLMLTTTSCTSS